jgi:anti-sigma regulatory factor (Ser/Thr protein kinase)
MDQRKVILSALLEAIDNTTSKVDMTRDELLLVLDEALTNAMEHGNNWDGSKQVHLVLWLEPEYLHVLIEDEGAGFNISNSSSEFEEGNKMSHRGRGLSLIRRFCTPRWKNAGRSIDLPIKLS